MKKEANFSDTMGYYMERNAPRWALYGGMAAVLSHLLAEMRSKGEEKKRFGGNRKEGPNVIKVKIPKTASEDPRLDVVWAVPAMVASTAGAGYASYKVLGALLKRLEERRLKKELAAAKEDYSDLVYEGLEARGLKRAVDGVALEDLSRRVVEDVEVLDALEEVNRKEATGVMGLGANYLKSRARWVVGGALTGALYLFLQRFNTVRKREKEVDDYYRRRVQDIPISTSVVIETEDPDKKKVAGASGQQQQSQGEDLRNRVSKARRADARLSKVKDLVNRVRPGGGEEQKSASFLVGGLLATNLARISSEKQIAEERMMQEAKAREEEDRKDRLERIKSDPIEVIDDNTIVVHTKDGPVTVDAVDPGAVEFLRQNPDAVKDLIDGTPMK